MGQFAEQITNRGELVRIKAIGHPTSEGFEQHYDRSSGLYAGYVSTVNNWGLGYRAFPSTLATGRLFDTLAEALDYLESGGNSNTALLRHHGLCHARFTATETCHCHVQNRGF
jgi:hypothetical protein